MKPNSNNRVCRRQSAAGVIRLQRIYPSSASGRTCVVFDSGGHQSASGGSAGGSASPTPARLERLSSLNPSSSPPNQQLPSPSSTPSPLSCRQHCSSYTYSTWKGLGTCNPYIPNEPNFKTSGLTVTLDMIRTYNDNQPKKRKKNEPNPNPMQTQSKPNSKIAPTQNPNKNRIIDAIAPIKIIKLLTQMLKAISIPDSLFDLTEIIILGQGRTLWLM